MCLLFCIASGVVVCGCARQLACLFVCVCACACVCVHPDTKLVTSSRGARAPVTSLAQRSQVTGVDAVADHHCVPAFGLASGPPVALE